MDYAVREAGISLPGLWLSPPVFLAPMAGLTHSAFRRLLLGIGGVGLYSTEMLSARSLPAEDPGTSPYLLRDPSETPLSYQILAATAEEAAPAVDVLHILGAEVVDLNFGCPAPEARRRGAGAWLMDRPEVARGLVAAARRHSRVPLSAKIRLGRDLDEGRLCDFCRMLEGEGVDLITVHARLRGEPYGRAPRWDWIGKVKSWVSVPVVGNGGIFSSDDARRCLALSGCDGVMLGRGLAARPWVASEIARDVFGIGEGPDQPSRPTLYRRFAELLGASFPRERQLGRLKEFTHYFCQTYPFGHHLASAVQSSRCVEEALGRAEIFFQRNDPDELEGNSPCTP